MTTTGPAVMFKQFDDRGFVFATNERSDVAGGRVLFQFKSDAQFRTFRQRLNDEVLPLFAKDEFQILAQHMFGAGAVGPKGAVKLNAGQLRQMLDVAEVT